MGEARGGALSGVDVKKVKIVVYAISGFLRRSQDHHDLPPNFGQPNSGGDDGARRDRAAVVIGGTAMTGGEGGLFGAAIGVLIDHRLHNGLDILGVSAFWQKVAIGLVILVGSRGPTAPEKRARAVKTGTWKGSGRGRRRRLGEIGSPAGELLRDQEGTVKRHGRDLPSRSALRGLMKKLKVKGILLKPRCNSAGSPPAIFERGHHCGHARGHLDPCDRARAVHPLQSHRSAPHDGRRRPVGVVGFTLVQFDGSTGTKPKRWPKSSTPRA